MGLRVVSCLPRLGRDVETESAIALGVQNPRINKPLIQNPTVDFAIVFVSAKSWPEGSRAHTGHSGPGPVSELRAA